jgi:hypothetical protein
MNDDYPRYPVELCDLRGLNRHTAMAVLETHHQQALAAKDAEIATLKAAMPPSDRLRLLADWFDHEPDNHRPDWHEHTVQSDLRVWADHIDAALGEPPAAGEVPPK